MRTLKPRRVAINGKFLSAAPTGVHRVAAELTKAVDAIVGASGTKAPWRILKPRNASRTLSLSHIPERTVGVTTWQPWEQIDLPVIARRDLLLNLCNLGPLFHPASVVMMHDAQVFSTPESYTSRFRLWYRLVQPMLGRSALRILTVSEFSKSQLVHYRVAPEDKIVVVHNGCDHINSTEADSLIVPRLRLTSKKFVVALANAQMHKNVGLLLQAFTDTRLRDLKLVLVGKAGAADFELTGFSPPKNAVFAGAVSDAELKGLYENALCLAFPSTTEGFGLPPLEAMSCGCPAVVAPCGALPEVCGAAAVYASPSDASQWIEAIARLADEPSHRAERADAGRVHAQGFSWRKSAEVLLRVIDGV